MVLGLKTNRASVEVIIHIQEVKPWPTPRAALIQWEYGERASGFTNQVMPSHGRIEFNESFRLRHEDSYQRNCIELSVYEARRDTRGGQLMGTAVVDLGVIKENVSISTPIKCKRNHRNSPQPLLFLKIQGADDDVKKASSTSRKETRKVPQNLNLDVEGRINVLEGELREAAALELSLYSVAAQHGSSMNKVHAPARRLSRLYFHANKHSGTGSVVSGLIVVAKACGNDVPRLTFWLSNTIILRAIISKPPHEMGKGPVAFAAALEKVEAWIFSRIIESLWWQTFTPHMHSIRNSDTTKSSSLELWKKAFKDACERICPVRGGGHGCGCLPLLSTLIMEQLVARLDVAMFNAILRESADEIPTDPVADPISDANVLPIPAGKASFGAGAQLKNTIGNWSRWLTDLFGMDDDDGDDRSSKAFCLLNALSDLMMLPKDLLSSPSIRKEVCPTFGLPLLRRILNSFVPDEFCPDPIPGPVLEALNSEDNDQDSIASHPCEAAAVAYQSPSAHSVASIMGASQLASLLKKSHTSDDELDQLDSPIIMESSRSKHNTSPSSSVRYQLLRQVWKE